jgi:septal ring factor EnvC (AmiA/AmiB activator)
MKLIDLFEGQDDLTYKEKKVKDVLDRVTVELSGSYSGSMSRLTSRYAKLDRQAKLMTERRNEVNAEMKEVSQRLFDAEDEVLTRVIETVSYTITLTKAEKAADKESKKTVDYSAILKELSKMVPELEEKIKDLTEKYTEISEAKDTPTQLRIKSKVDEGMIGRAWAWTKTFLDSITVWGKGYDARLDKLKELAKGN